MLLQEGVFIVPARAVDPLLAADPRWASRWSHPIHSFHHPQTSRSYGTGTLARCGRI